jgi:hypothetical protein
MGQDWGGRRKVNPARVPKTTRKQVEHFAAENNVQIKRPGPGNGTWWLLFPDGQWRTAGMTNWIALQSINLLISCEHKRVRWYPMPAKNEQEYGYYELFCVNCFKSLNQQTYLPGTLEPFDLIGEKSAKHRDRSL